MTARFLLTLLFCFGLSTPSFAVTVAKVKGKKVLVDGQGEELAVGQIYLVKNADGKSVGIIKLTKVSKGKAMAILGKGVAEPGQSLALRKSKGPKHQESASNEEESPSVKTRKPSADQAYWGGMVGYTMSKADITLTDGTKVSLDGSGFSAKILYDYPLFSSVSFRGLAGLEQFNVGGVNNTASCSGECKAEIMYLTLDLWGRLHLNEGSFRTWVGAGGWLTFPMTKDSNAIKESSISNSNVFALGGGFDYYTSPTTYLPFQIEYQMYPKSSNVNASAIAIRGGFAIPW